MLVRGVFVERTIQCAKVRRELGELGCIGPLIGMLDGKAIEDKQAAVRAFSVI